MDTVFHTDCIIEYLEKKVESLKEKLKEHQKEVNYLTKYHGYKVKDMDFVEFMDKVDSGEIKNDKPTKTLH
jgi:hypothetical protein